MAEFGRTEMSEASFLGVASSALGMHVSVVPDSLQEIRATIQAITQKPRRSSSNSPKRAK